MVIEERTKVKPLSSRPKEQSDEWRDLFHQPMLNEIPRQARNDTFQGLNIMKKFKNTVSSFLSWYERHYTLNVGIAAFLFVWQLVHLYWLTTHVVFLRLFNVSLFNLQGVWQYLIIVVDYTEIPALISTSFVYIFGLIKKFSWKNILFLVFINSQWLHLFWITDEFVIKQFSFKASSFALMLAWIAIFIDYLELPVIYDTLKKFFASLRGKK